MKAAKANFLISMIILMGGVIAHAEETAHADIQVTSPVNLVLKPHVTTETFSMGFAGSGIAYALRYGVYSKGDGSGSVSCPATTKKVSCYRPNPNGTMPESSVPGRMLILLDAFMYHALSRPGSIP